MSVVFWLLAGGLVGGLTSSFMRADVQQRRALNVFVGMLGALLVGWLGAPLAGTDEVEAARLGLPALTMPLLGAALLLAAVTALRRRGVR